MSTHHNCHHTALFSLTGAKVSLCFDEGPEVRDMVKGPDKSQIAGSASVLTAHPEGRIPPQMVKLTNFVMNQAKRKRTKKGEPDEEPWSAYTLPWDHVLDQDGLPFNGKNRVALQALTGARAPFFMWGDYLWRKPTGKKELSALTEYMDKRKEDMALEKATSSQRDPRSSKK
jgi:hypothetical protein